MENASRLVASAVIGMDFKTIVVNGKSYTVLPPTINKIAGASYYMTDLGDVETVKDIFASLKNMKNAAKALSWFIAGDESLEEELSEGTLDEVISGLEDSFSLVSAENFIRLSILARSVANLIAKQK